MSDIGVALQLTGISKRFAGTIAVDGVDLTVYSGEVHALVGANGAGKSTLVKVIAGAFHDYTGQVAINGKEVRLHSPATARANGIQMIHQELSLAPALSILDNVLAGRLPRRRGLLVDRRAALAEAKECLERVGLDLDPRTPVEEISQHEAQLVEIAKALANRPCILLLDEPTSALGRQEVERLFELIRRLRSVGLAIVYISHHLPEITAIADRVTVLRDGRKVATEPIRDVTAEALARMVVGASSASDLSDESERSDQSERATTGACVQVQRLTRRGFFRDVSFAVGRGEIVGLAGLSGSGRTELARSLCGVDPIHAGEMRIDGERVVPNSMGDAVRAGIAYVTEDRKALGLALRLTVGENAGSALIGRRSGSGDVVGMLERLHVEPPDPSRIVRHLSGGNQQKVLLAKWLATEPLFLILDEPTRGVDVGARAVLHDAIRRQAAEGAAVLLISSDIPELVSLSDRIVVMRRGRVAGELSGPDATEEKVLLSISADEGQAVS